MFKVMPTGFYREIHRQVSFELFMWSLCWSSFLTWWLALFI